jgi:hypothetical protein
LSSAFTRSYPHLREGFLSIKKKGVFFMSHDQQQHDLRRRQEVAEQAKRLAESLAGKAQADKQAEFPREFSATGKSATAAIEP